MAIDLKTIDERLAKAKEEAEFWEKARAILEDPRLKALSATVPTPAPTPAIDDPALREAGAYGSLRRLTYEKLPAPDSSIGFCVTTSQLISELEDGGYTFTANEKMVAVNAALVALEEKGLAEWVGKRGLARLWRKKKKKSQEASEEAS